MKVKELLKKKGKEVITISEGTAVVESIKVMNEHKIGSLLVVTDSGDLAGIITERDILQECGKKIDRIGTCLVKDVMTRDLIVGIPGDSIEYLLGVMSKNKIRHLPIIENNSIAGIVSIIDLVESQLHEMEYKNRYMEEYIKS